MKEIISKTKPASYPITLEADIMNTDQVLLAKKYNPYLQRFRAARKSASFDSALLRMRRVFLQNTLTPEESGTCRSIPNCRNSTE